MNLPIEIKKQLSLIIKNNRLYKLDKTRNLKWTVNNPYNKDNLCKSICHYYTLTKLEENYINNDTTYKLLLNKLGYSFNVTYEKHVENMEKLTKILYSMLKASEYLEDDLMIAAHDSLTKLDFHHDAIAYIHLILLKTLYKLYFIEIIEDFYIEQLTVNKDIFSNIFSSVYKYIMGVIYIDRRNFNQAYNFFIAAKECFEKYQFSKGLTGIHIISYYMMDRDYFKMVNLCLEMESFYQKTQNFKRLLQVYIYLADYYLIIDSYLISDNYYKKSLEIIQNDKSLARYYSTMEYNRGLYLLKKYKFKEALTHMKKALDNFIISKRELQIINVILFIMTKLKVDKKEIISMVERGKACFNDGFATDQIVFKYFIYKYENNPYYRKYALQKLVPLIKSSPKSIDLLLILYEDLYE